MHTVVVMQTVARFIAGKRSTNLVYFHPPIHEIVGRTL